MLVQIKTRLFKKKRWVGERGSGEILDFNVFVKPSTTDSTVLVNPSTMIKHLSSGTAGIDLTAAPVDLLCLFFPPSIPQT